jgi:hypothetical protein
MYLPKFKPRISSLPQAPILAEDDVMAPPMSVTLNTNIDPVQAVLPDGLDQCLF